MLKVGIYWFCNDLRLLDNSMLLKAATEVDKLICIYCFDPLWLLPNRYGLVSMSVNRVSFLKESLIELDKQLLHGSLMDWAAKTTTFPHS